MKSLSWGGGATPPYRKNENTSTPTTLRMDHFFLQISQPRLPPASWAATLPHPPHLALLHAKPGVKVISGVHSLRPQGASGMQGTCNFH